MELRFYYDVVCPYAYIASTRIAAIAERFGADLVWCPVLLGGIYRSIDAPDYPPMAPSKARLNGLDLMRQAELAGAPLEFPAEHPRRTVDAMRLLCAAPDAARPELTAALYRAYWVEGEDVADPTVLARYARAFGVEPDRIKAPETKQALFDNTAEAVERGLFGVPGFAVGERFWWGNDRLHLVVQALGGARAEAEAYAGGLTPEGALATKPAPEVVTFYHDFSSPFSYLGSTRIARFAAARGARLQAVPILLGALFNQIGTPNVPMFAMPAPKQRYMGRDLKDWAAWWGVPFRWPSTFPLRTIAPLRVAIQEPATAPAIYRAAWAEDRNIGDPEVLGAVLSEAGFDAAALLAGCQDPAIKARLRENTERARDAGVCGVPSYEVGGHLFWGQDRLYQMDAALSGWSPRLG